MPFSFPWRMAHMWEGSKGQRKEGGKMGMLQEPCVQPGTVPPAEHVAEGCGTVWGCVCIILQLWCLSVAEAHRKKTTHAGLRMNGWLALAFGIFSVLHVVLIMENAGVVRYLPGAPWPFRNPCCQLSSAPTVSQEHVLAFPGEISCQNRVYSFNFFFFFIQALILSLLWCSPETQETENHMSVFQWIFFFYLKAPLSQRVKNFAHCEFCFCGDSSCKTINGHQLILDDPWAKSSPVGGWALLACPCSLLPDCTAGGLEKLPGRPGFIAERFTLFIWKKCRMPSPRSLCLHKLRVFIIHRNTAHSLFLCHLSLITYASDVRIQSRFLSILGFKT